MPSISVFQYITVFVIVLSSCSSLEKDNHGFQLGVDLAAE